MPGAGSVFDDLVRAAAKRRLAVLGGFHPTPADGAPPDCRTLLMLGPAEPAFWPAFTKSAEYTDGRPDPMDRWSARVIGQWAGELSADALFPFGGPPHQPFYRWALRTGRVHASPIRLLVHDKAGLFVSFRGAIALRYQIDLPAPPESPCLSCATQPCLSACPVNAFGPDGYDVKGCKQFVLSALDRDCLTKGCRARRACPVSQGWGRIPAQSQFHMTNFTEV